MPSSDGVIPDATAVLTHAQVALENAPKQEPAFLFMVDAAPLYRRLGIYEVLG